MAFFTKTDPAVKSQRDLEAKLKAKRTSRDDLVERRKVAEAGAAAHRAKACELAAEGANDTALSAAETAMRRELDRVETLIDAIAQIDVAIADLEKTIAQIVDQRCRAETAAAISALVEKWSSTTAAFNAAMNELVEVARDSAVIVVDAHPIKVFLEAVQAQVPPEADLITNVLQGRAKAVLEGTAPASLPRPAPAAPVPSAAIAQEPQITYSPVKTGPRFKGAVMPSPKLDPVLAAANIREFDRGLPEREITIAVPRF
jgi:hypothetical protein